MQINLFKTKTNNITGFTLAEAMITLVMLGVLAALTTPIFLHGSDHKRFEILASKALQAVNHSIAVNITNAKGTTFRTNDLCNYLVDNMPATVACQTYTNRPKLNMYTDSSEPQIRQDMNFNYIETNEQIQYFFPTSSTSLTSVFENIKLYPKYGSTKGSADLTELKYSNCGSKASGARTDANIRNVLPCVILVDVNGDKGPNMMSTNGKGDKDIVRDMFFIIVTEKEAYPYGSAVQKALYGEK